MTAVPTRSRRVRVAIELATWSDAEITERFGVKWISPSQTQSRPQASARWRQLERVPERRDLARSVAHLLDEDPEMHGGSLLERAPSDLAAPVDTRPAPSVPSRA